MHSAKKRKSVRAAHAGTGRGPASRSSHREDRPRARYRALLIAALAVAGLLGSVLVFLNGGTTGASSGAGDAMTRMEVRAPAGTPAGTGTPTRVPDGKPSVTPGGKPHAAPTPGVTKPGTGSAAAGTGRFITAAASGKPVGTGAIRRYKVQVEQGSGVPATTAADEISGILADPRGWTADGHDAFQLVSSGPYDFEIKIATPPTVDRICGAAGLHTHGEVNCDVGDQVIVNLKRWNTGSPEFPGPLHDYRALIINHEVGHRIGHGHEGCPGPGRPAPAMMQQIDGLHGCTANAWPYDSHGTYLGGPPVP
ncbi:DUF3152 domain-containing protein [Streptomyces polygonati]|uniref:DUF3152 domain-containing protein n=1 Tax=Streptomyces polygonati TaxID=1617087 RepID=A0ABV8HQK2_9ACTN